MRSLRPLAASGLSNPIHNPTPLPYERMVHRRVSREYRRVSTENPTTTNPLLMPETPAIVGFVGLFEKV
jgi:hypothetical protein